MSTSEPHLSQMAHGLVGSEVLRIAAEIRERLAQGEKVFNFTVGDYRPELFPVPKALLKGVTAALTAGETNYPPSDGMPDLRKALARFYVDRLDLDYPPSCIVVAAGVRPAIYCTFRTLLDPGETVIIPVPSWNNNHYTWLMGCRAALVVTRPENRFLPTADDLAPAIGEARLLALNSPLNPAGTAFTRDELAGIVEQVLEENRRREAAGRRPLMVMYDQVYWMLCYGDTAHVTPVGIDERMRDYTIFVDGISKAFAATGLRVGWGVGPEPYMKPFSDILGHMGAWAPRAEQVATAGFLSRTTEIDRFLTGMEREIGARLNALHEGFEALRGAGYPVMSLKAQGTIYMTVRIDLIGKRAGNRVLSTNEEIRRFLLEEASLAVVPFQAFSLADETGWFRLSVGAVTLEDCRAIFPELKKVLDGVM